MDAKELKRKLLHDIEQGIIQNTEGRLPSEPELMAHYQVTRYALRAAFNSLVDQGFIYQVQGKGTFVRKRSHKNAITLDQTAGLTEEAKRLGKELKTVYAKLMTIKASEALYIPDETDISEDEELYYVERLRYLGEEPFVLEYSYYRKKFIPYLNQEIVENSIYDYIKQALNINLGFADKFIYCEACDEKQADVLNLSLGSPVLVLKDEAYLNSGEVFNFSKLFYHPDIQFFMLAKMT